MLSRKFSRSVKHLPGTRWHSTLPADFVTDIVFPFDRTRTTKIHLSTVELMDIFFIDLPQQQKALNRKFANTKKMTAQKLNTRTRSRTAAILPSPTILQEFSQNSLGILPEFSRNSSRILSEFLQNSLGILPDNSSRVLSEFFSKFSQNYLRILP